MLLVAVATDLLDRFIISEILTFLYTYSWIVEFILWPFMVAELYYICTEVCVGRNDVVHGVRNKEEQFRRSRRCFVELFPGTQALIIILPLLFIDQKSSSSPVVVFSVDESFK